MNLDDERKAYEKHRESWTTATTGFDTWLAAKEHARHMLKPVATILMRKDHHGWAVYVPTSLTAEAFDFQSKEDAESWAVNRGYRIEEVS